LGETVEWEELYFKLHLEALGRAGDYAEYREIRDAFWQYPELAASALDGDPRDVSEMAEKCAEGAKTREQAVALLKLARVFGLKLSERTRAKLIAKAL